MKREIDGFVMNRLQGALLEEAFRLVADGYAGVEDVDVGIRDGLALRWSFMGPFETIELNAPAGVRDYVDRYEGIYSNMFPSDAMARRLGRAGHRQSRGRTTRTPCRRQPRRTPDLARSPPDCARRAQTLGGQDDRRLTNGIEE